MSVLEELLKTLKTLLGPDGCAWDRAQTLSSIRASLLEETCEVIDAIDACDGPHIKEELGDLLFNALFLCLLAEKEHYGTFYEIVQGLNDKLIYRHPHVFGGKDQIATPEAVLDQWDQLKKTEKGKEKRQSALDGIPKALPVLARAQKVLKKMKKKGFVPAPLEEKSQEIAVGNSLLQLVLEAQVQSVEAEFALRNVLDQHETAFKAYEAELVASSASGSEAGQ
jgi:tetrapyrrole methylase family protein/MazG family protein